MRLQPIKLLSRIESLKQFFPFLEWLPELKYWSNLKSDILAGLTVVMLLIPQSMAYAHLAGIPVYMGLYAAFIPPIIAALFSSSRSLSTGPVPVTSLLTAVALQPIAAIGTNDYLSYLVLLTFLIGLIQLGLSFIRFGVVVNFVSYPVLLGLINAVAIVIASMQINSLFGVYAVTSPHFYETFWQVINDAIANPHWPTMAIAALSFIIILGGRWLWPKWPHILFAVLITTIVAWLSGYEKTQIIQVNQIINLPVQQLLENYKAYPQALEEQIAAVKKAQKKVENTIRKEGPSAEETDEAINEAAEAKWQMERLILRHNLETAELSRLRFRRMKTENLQEVFYVDDQMTPIGQVDPRSWRIAEFPEAGFLKIQAGGEVVGKIPRGLPSFKPVVFNSQIMRDLFMAALVIALVGFTEAITIAKRIATESRQSFDTNQELISQGLAKCVGSYFQCMPVSGSFTRTALNYQSGARTPFSSVVAGFVVMVVLLWLTPLFYYLPYATLGVIIMVGVLSLLDIKEMWRVWKISRNEGIVALTTFIMALVLAPRIAFAVMIGILLSLVFYLYETMRPKLSELIRDEHGELVEVTDSDAGKTCYLISILRFNGPLYFANAAYFEHKVLELISVKQKLRYIILDCVSLNQLDATGVETLRSVSERLEEAGIELWFTRVRRPVMRLLKRSGLVKKLGPHHFYKNNEIALAKLSEHLGPKHMNTCPLAKMPIKTNSS
ncbi:SulP family inorganic anion transporter [Legionella yabuuchiae]|uniref:SulP family inorganic anion transporter n=1 Tax=Legionella yabuuchiae TaxID=376727 RepID=UPI0010543DE6|nr:SulP family inorganic anion transporter [Legionella yabuuchiae]